MRFPHRARSLAKTGPPLPLGIRTRDLSVLARALYLDECRFLDPRTRDSLTPGRPYSLPERTNCDQPAGPRRLVERLYDANVLKTFFSGRFRVTIVHDAVRKVQELGRELITLGECLAHRLSIDRQRVFEAFGIFVRRISMEIAFRSDNSVRGDVGGIETRHEGRHAFVAEPQDRSRRFVDLCQC